MMMPANFSAVAENEMTYVVGGGLVDVLAPVMNEQNWQNISTNLINIVGNSYLNKFVGGALAHVFAGNYHVGDNITTWGNGMKAIWNNNYYKDGNVDGDKLNWGFANSLLNTGLQVVGALAAIYTLGDKKIGLDCAKSFDLSKAV